jgi:hypothetical protein
LVYGNFRSNCRITTTLATLKIHGNENRFNPLSFPHFALFPIFIKRLFSFFSSLVFF